MKRIKATLALLLALCMAFSLCACGKSDTQANTPGTDAPAGDVPAADAPADDPVGSEPAGEPAVNKLSLSTYDMYAEKVEPIEATQVLDVGMNGVAVGYSFNPAGENGTITHESFRILVYDFAWGFDADNNNERYSRILSDWYYEDDTTFVMVLRPGIYFQTKAGKYAEMTGEDVLFSMACYADQGSPYAGNYANFNFETSYVSDDGLTVYLKTDEPYGPFPRTFPVICKKWVEENGWDTELWETDPCSSGPYTAGTYVTGASASVVLRDTPWWNYDYRQPEAKEVVIHLYSELSTLYIDLETGTIDLALGISDSDYDRALQSGENIAVKTTTSGKMTFMGLSGSREQNKYLADENVRLAIAHAVDWNAVAEASFGSLYAPVTGIISPSSPYYTEGLVEQYSYDPELAKSILEEAGYAEGEIVFNNVNFGTQATIAEAIQAYLSVVGITMEVETYEFLTAMFSWMGTGDPPCDTAFNDQTDASGEPNDNLGYFYDSPSANFPVLIVRDETYNELYSKFLHTIDGRQEAADELVTYAHEHCLFFPVGICKEAFGYRTDVISAVNIFSTQSGGPDFDLITYVD